MSMVTTIAQALVGTSARNHLLRDDPEYGLTERAAHHSL